MSDETATQEPPRMEAFSFGDPEPVLDRFDFLYTGCWLCLLYTSPSPRD